jgi:hypothetical protein
MTTQTVEDIVVDARISSITSESNLRSTISKVLEERTEAAIKWYAELKPEAAV